MKFTPLQTLVAEHYIGGEFAYVTDTDDLDKAGDTLFTFMILEANDAQSIWELRVMLDLAVEQIRDFIGETS